MKACLKSIKIPIFGKFMEVIVVLVTQCNFYVQEIPTIYMDFLRNMLIVMDSRANYSNYRDMLKNTVPPAVPYLGMSVKWSLHCIIYFFQVCF